jgi:hypothetical protein
MLVPAGFLVVLILASIAIDMSIVQLRQRQAFDIASAAANDAAGAGGDVVRHDGGDAFRIDQDRASRVARQVVAASDIAPLVTDGPVVTVSGRQVEVELSVRASSIFARAIPGAPDGLTVRARATALAAG